jgi:sulfur carrier protein
MRFKLNGKQREVNTENYFLSELLKDENLLASGGIAVAVNQQIIPRADWDKKIIRQDDSVLIIRAAQGG